MTSPAPDAPVVGVLLAAGAGTRLGMPKALVVDSASGEPWLLRGIRTLQAGGCAPVVVVLGAEADRARALLAPSPSAHEPVPPAADAPDDVEVVVAEDWATGQAASLRAGLVAARRLGAAAVVVTLVDLPELTSASVTRLLTSPTPATALRQAAYGGRPGHPVVIGAAHFDALLAELEGDTGARPYLRAHGVTMVDCSDLGGGDDVDTLPAR